MSRRGHQTHLSRPGTSETGVPWKGQVLGRAPSLLEEKLALGLSRAFARPQLWGLEPVL